jgi:GDP-D-mannose dehydratase
MFTHTGPRRGEVFVVSAFAKQIAKIELGLQEPLLKVGNLDSVRTFLDVRDAVKAYYLLVQQCTPGDVYNIGGNATMTVGKMLDLLLSYSTMKEKIKVEIDKKLLRPSDVTLQIPDISKFVKVTNWKPEIPLEKTLKDTLDYWRQMLKR